MKNVYEKIIKQKEIIYKQETRTVSIGYCPFCGVELYETGKEYKPYYCKCGAWYYNEDDDYFKIVKVV